MSKVNVINIRKLAAVDLALNGTRFIVAEFAIGRRIVSSGVLVYASDFYSKFSLEEEIAMTEVIERIILDRPRADVTPEELATANEVGQALLLAIPGVEAVSFGIALTADEPYQWYVRIRFRDEAALETFNTHPNHLNFAEKYWGPLLADHSVRDYRLQY